MDGIKETDILTDISDDKLSHEIGLENCEKQSMQNLHIPNTDILRKCDKASNTDFLDTEITPYENKACQTPKHNMFDRKDLKLNLQQNSNEIENKNSKPSLAKNSFNRTKWGILSRILGKSGGEYQREEWTSKTEFLLAIIGFSVDLGNIWRFPKVVYDNGGGRFMIPYFIQLLFCGLPLFYMELALGQFHQTGVFTLWEKICPIMKGLAFGTLVINVLMGMFYNTIIAWAVYYFFLSFSSVVPWRDCDNPWNTDCCLPMKHPDESKLFSDYKISENGLRYRNISDKLILYNNENMMTTTDDIRSLLKLDSFNSTIMSNFTSNNELFDSWLSSYYVYFNETLMHMPNIYLNESMAYDIKFDNGLIIKLIESAVSEMYANSSYSLVLNCSNFIVSPTQEFYSRYLIEIHKSRGLEDIGAVKWQVVVCLFLVFVTVYFALWKGIKSAGKAVWITATAPYIIMFILLIRGLTLEGSWDGIVFYLGVDDWNSIFHYKVWIDAAAQIFFSLGPGFGTIIALASYNKKSNNCYKDALLTSFINCLTSILSGFVVFTTLGHMAKMQGKSVNNVISGGPGLVFITYPEAISLMPGAPFWAVIFFFMLFTLGIDSTFGGLESVITGISDSFPSKIGPRRSQFVFVFIFLCFLGAIPTATYGGPYIVNLLDAYAITPALLFIAFLEVIGVMYCYGYERFSKDVEQMIHQKPGIFWKICWKYISPAIVLAMIFLTCRDSFKEPLYFGDYRYDGIGKYLSYLLVGVPLFLVVIYVPCKLYKTPGSTLKERFLNATFVSRRNEENSNDEKSKHSDNIIMGPMLSRSTSEPVGV